jgi:membrane protein
MTRSSGARKGARPSRLSLGGFWEVLKEASVGWWDDNVPRMGAALAYYALIALAPVLIVVIAVGGIAFGSDAVRGDIIGQITGLVGREAAQTVQTMLAVAAGPAPNFAVTVIGLCTFFFGATGAFLELRDDLDVIWRVKRKSRGSFLYSLLLERVVSLGLVLGFAFLLLMALLASAGLAVVNGYLERTLPAAALLWKVVELVLSLGVIALVCAMIYRVIPDVRLKWAEVGIGALVTAALFMAGNSLIGLYLGANTFATRYGTAGSVIVVLVWVYYSSQILLFGAEFTRAYIAQAGPPPKPVEGSVPDAHPR